ncbi:MAG: IS30 family transposase [Oscillospiraceae bacterium]|nr:IS30 family transposase [Oscillospiraceae bacterium]
MSHYQHLTIKERESLWEYRIKGESIREIARQLGRSPSTVSRELRRNQGKHGYRPSAAQEKYHVRRACSRRHRILCPGPLRDTVVRPLTQQQWSPEQIAERLSLERGARPVSYSTIYRALKDGYMEPKGTRKNRHGRYPMQKNLRRKGWRGTKKTRKTAAFVHQTIEVRPKAAETLSQFGHFEGDLVYSSFHKLYVVTLVDRRSRYLLTGIIYSKKPEEVARVMISMLRSLPKGMLRSVTLDRGQEFAHHSNITAQIPEAEFYFAHPHSPWERGCNENTNGLLRQYIPKNTYKVQFSPELLAQFTDKLNRRPRKCLNWKSPLEVFSHKLLHFT